MSDLRVSSIVSRKVGTSPKAPDGVIVSGIATATTFDGNLTGNVTGSVTGNVSGNITGDISGATGTFSGDVSVGGTVTYEDVSSVDSVGVITARGGIKVGAGQSVSAVSGIVTYYGDGSQLTGVESGVFDFIASGTLSNGQTVLINTDGTVSAVRQTVVTDSLGSAQYWYQGNSFDAVSVSVANNKIVIVYRDLADGNKGRAVVGTINGTTITFGNTATWRDASTDYVSASYNSSAGSVVIAYKDNGNSGYPHAVAGQVSGTSINFGSVVQLHNYAPSGDPILCIYDSNAQRNLVTYRANGNWGASTVLSVSGTTVTVYNQNSPTYFYGSGQSTYHAVVYDSNKQRILVGYTDQGNQNYFRAKVGQISGNTISYGAETIAHSSWVFLKKFAFDPVSNQVICFYSDYNADTNGSRKGRARVATINAGNNTVTFGAAYEFESNALGNLGNNNVATQFFAHASNSNKNYFIYNSGGRAILRIVSANGDVISYGSTTDLGQNMTSLSYDPGSNNLVISYREDSTNYGASKVFAPGSTTNHLTAENYIGIAAEAISNGATGKINIATGINEGQTGLTTGQKYYVQNNGSLSTSADSPSVVAGTAISSTKIIVKG